MTTFSHRDRRIGVVEAALGALDPRIGEIKTQLEGPLTPPQRQTISNQLSSLQLSSDQLRTEQTLLAADSFETGDGFVEALARDRLWRDGAGILGMMRRDPVYGAGAQPLLLTDAMAAEIGTLPRDVGRSRDGFLEEVAGKIGDAQALEETIGSVQGDWLRSDPDTRISPFNDVGVMLPLRLETIFDDRGDFWEMSLRVVPDEVSIRRDQPKVTPMEKAFLDEFWARSALIQLPAGTPASEWLAHPEGVAAWEHLAARVTPPRAAWLVTVFGAEVRDAAFAVTVPADRIGGGQGESIFGLPKELLVTIIDRDGKLTELGSLHPDLSEERFGLPAGEAAFDSWLLSWEKAKTVGMGGIFKLEHGPERIATLYVHGIGDEDAATLFGAHVTTGSLAMVRLGAPTNTVHGAPAADLAPDPESWRILACQRLTGEAGAGVAPLAAALCGDQKALPVLPGASHDMEDARMMVQALWPALWGHYVRDLIDGGDNAMLLWFWCLEALHPEGPLPPIRIDAQPYGILPVTPLDRWQPLHNDNLAPAEEKIVKGLSQLMPPWVEAAEKNGTIVGADTLGLLGLLARPGVSSRYVYRSYVPAEIQVAAYPGVDRNDFMQLVEKLWSPANDVTQHKMGRLYLAQGYPQSLLLPLIGSNRLLPPEIGLTDMLKQLYEMRNDLFASAFYEKFLGGLVPKSLLVRLMIHSALLAKAWAVQTPPAAAVPLINPLQWDDPRTSTELERLQMRFPDRALSGEPVEKLMQINQESIFRLASQLDQYLKKGEDPMDKGKAIHQLKLPPERHAQLERALRATLDTAAHRIDPFATGVAWRRLQAAMGSSRSLHRLCAYGWLDGPFIGKPGPTDARRLHAPSHAQAITSIVLRDKQISSRDEKTADGRNVWDMTLSSASVRLAVEMAEEVRFGFHIYEVVGRRVESIVGNREKVRLLRRLKPLRPHAPDDRDSCHGIDALDALLSPAGLPGILEDEAAQRPRLEAIRTALEAYADLLAAEGVYQVVSGRAERGADAMDAAAGFARPPEFDVVKTPPSGYRLGTSVIGIFAHRIAGADAAPLELADASLAGFIAVRFARGGWTWTVKDGGNVTATVTLDELGLEPAAAALMSEDFLVQAVRCKANTSGQDVDVPDAHRLARLLTSAMGGGPAVLSDVTKNPGVDDVAARASEKTVRAGLAKRYGLARDALSNLVDALRTGAPDNAGRIALLRKTIAWGFVGPAGSSPPTLLADILFGSHEATEEQLDGLLTAAEQALKARLPEDPAAEASQPIAQLTRAIGELVAPGGRLTISARWSVADLMAASKLNGVPDATLEDEWLAVTAAVRPPLARVEAVQLEARHLGRGAPLGVWSNAAGDPWRKTLVKANANLRDSGQLTKIGLDRLVVAFGDPNAFGGGDVAVALIDQFSEAIPMPQRSTYAGLGFNAPAARPPQAILLALPSRPDRRLDASETLQILRETHKLLRVRAAQPGDAVHPTLPTAWLDASSPLRVRVDSGSQYRR